MPIREFVLPGDLDILADVIPSSFQYPENEDWSIQDDEVESILDQMNGMKRIWPVIRLVQLIAPPMRDLMRGYVWEEDGKAVGVVNVVRRGNTDQWLIGNVSVLPDYRRRGIARKLVEATIQYVQDRGARQITLDVIDGNVPAYTLYERLGFAHYTGHTELNYAPHGTLEDVALPEGYVLEERDLLTSRPSYELAQHIVPEQIRQFEPVEEGSFRQPKILGMLAPIIFRAMGGRPTPFVVRREPDGRVVASISLFVRTRKGGTNSLRINLDPECSELAPILVHTMLREIERRSSGRRIEATAKHWQQPVIEAMEAAGFQRRSDWHTLGIRCEGG